MNIFALESGILLAVQLLLLAVKIFAFGNSLMFPAEAYEAAGKLTKTTWAVILGLGVVLSVVSVGFFILTLVFTIAAFVYLADVRPALTGLYRR